MSNAAVLVNIQLLLSQQQSSHEAKKKIDHKIITTGPIQEQEHALKMNQNQTFQQLLGKGASLDDIKKNQQNIKLIGQQSRTKMTYEILMRGNPVTSQLTQSAESAVTQQDDEEQQQVSYSITDMKIRTSLDEMKMQGIDKNLLQKPKEGSMMSSTFNMEAQQLIMAKQKRTRICIIRVSSRLKFYWDILIIMLAVYNCFAIPFIFAFNPDYAQTDWIFYHDETIDFLFLIDIIINFRTTYFDEDLREEIYNGRKIARRYFFSLRFWIDLLSTIPFDKILSTIVSQQAQQFLSALGMLKLFRIGRISILIQKLNYARTTKGLFKAAHFIFFLILFIHIQGCILFFIVKQKEMWIPNEDLMYFQTQLYTSSISHQYWICIYHSTEMFGINEIVPFTTIELCFTSVMMLISAMLNANIFGLIALLVAQMNEKTQKFQEQIDIANTAMKNIKLSHKLQKEVVYYLLSTQSTQDAQEEFQSFLDGISPSLRIKIQMEIFMIALKKNEIIKILQNEKSHEVSHLLDSIVKKLEIELASPENEILKQGSDDLAAMYYLQKGECNVIVSDKIGLDSGVKRVRTLYPGDHFGEIGLIYNCRRTATVTASNYCTLAKLSAQKFRDISNKSSQYTNELKEQIFAYDDDVKIFLEDNLKKISYMKALEMDIFHEVMFSFKQETFDKGSHLFKEDERSNAMFIVKNGIIEISCTIEGQQLSIERLFRGSIINHNSFLISDKSDINGKCSEALTLFYLTYEQMQKVRMKSSKLNLEISKVEAFAQNKDNPFILDYVQCNSVIDQSKRPSFIEERRNQLTCRLKNAVLFHLVNQKQSKRRPNFKEVISQVIQKKKDDMKKLRKKQLMLTQGEDEDESKIEGLTKEQSLYINEQLGILRKKYTTNNNNLQQIEKMTSYLMHKNGGSESPSKNNTNDDLTPKFK